MSFLMGIRKYAKPDELQYWLVISAKPADDQENEVVGKVKYKVPPLDLYFHIINSIYWKIFIVITVLFNTFVFISYFWLDPKTVDSVLIIIITLTHSTCLFYWIDFLGTVMEKIFRKGSDDQITTSIIYLILDAVSLLPLSLLYLISVHEINIVLFWQLRAITLIRFYRIPRFFSQLSSGERNHWNILLAANVCYLIIFIIVFGNLVLYSIDEYSEIDIKSWKDSVINRIIFSLYYALEMVLNVGYGDIVPISYSQMLLNALATFVGTVASTGIFSGILGSAFMSKANMRENYRYEFDATRNTLKERHIDKKVMNDILDSVNTLWKVKKGYDSSPPIHILPMSLLKEIYFDINFGHLHRSLIFSAQPRSFLRSVSLFMKNVTCLPGDIILEPPGMSDVMICVASGVIEILSEENDESVLFSLTAGTIIGEATLFIPLPIRCIIRASTYVELQVLLKVNFSRLALTYPEIYRSMREEIFHRLEFTEEVTYLRSYRETKMRRQTKAFLSNLKKLERDGVLSDTLVHPSDAILGLYTLSENIPRVKTLPINLIRSRPWILRPDTTLIKLWDFVMVLVIAIVVILYPIVTAFVRKIDASMQVVLVLTRTFYVADVYIQCTTAVERKDHFTYITTVREIIGLRLTTFGFYLDVISMYYLGIYAPLVWPDNEDYARLLLSMNAVLKAWRVFSYMKKQENNMRNNLLLIVTIKYMVTIAIILTWGAAVLYLESRPGESYVEDRWFYQMEVAAVFEKKRVPHTVSHAAVSFYFAAVTIFALGYGDIVAKSIPDCVVVIICLISGFILIIACVSESSAAIKHLARLRTNYQEELFAVDRFMVEHEISKDHRLRVKEYIILQWDYDKGYSLKQISISQAMSGLQKRIIVMELSKSFLSVPLFRTCDPSFIKFLAKLCKVRVLPPGELITIKGSFIREMYIIENGFCQIKKNDANESYTKVIGPVTPFGYVEMILGGEQRVQIETLTHVRMVSLNYSSYLQAITKFPGEKMEIEEALNNFYTIDDESDMEYFYFEDIEPEINSHLNAQQEILSKTFIKVLKFHKLIATSYWEPFRVWGKCRPLQFLLMPIIINPESLFMKIWMSYRILKAVVIGIVAPVQFSLIDNTEDFMVLIPVLQVLTVIDIYLMFHVAYCDSRGLLMFHPAKTSTQYLKGSFILDLISVFPFYWMLEYFYPAPEDQRRFFIKSSGLIMCLQLYKFFQGFRYLEKDIRRKTDLLKVIKLFPLVCIVINTITGFVLLVQCYKVKVTGILELQGSTRLADELVESIETFCMRDYPRNQTITPHEKETLYKMYLIMLYWVTTTITVCGFGDIWAHNQTSMILVIAILTLGIFFFTYVFGSITSSMVNTNVLISKHRRRVLKMTRFMKMKKVHPHLQQRLILHYEYNWKRTEGESPQKILSVVHGALREQIISSMYEGIIRLNPAFQKLERTIVTIIGKHLEELYFLQGETIIKYKDTQEHIYLIYRGMVDVISPNKGVIVSMGSGGMFGNIKNESFSLSSESVIASENVDLIRLGRKAFFAELELFTSTKDFATFISSKKANYVEPLIPHLPLSAMGNFITKLNIFHIRRVSSDHESMKSSAAERVTGFYFKNSIFYIRGKTYATFVILPGIFKNLIDGFIFGMAYLSFTLTLYMFAFQDFSHHIIAMLYILDVMFLVEVFLQLHMTDADKFGDCIVHTKMIKQRYAKSRKLFYDIVTNVPLELFAFAARKGWCLKLLSILRLNRTFRLHYIFTFYFKKKRELMTNKIYLEIGWILTIITLLVHSLSCVWFVAVVPLGFVQEPTWVTDMNLLNLKAWEYYIYCMFHIVTITTTTGLQQLKIYSLPEVLLTMIFMITSRYVVVLLSGLLAATINAETLNLFLFQQRITQLKDTFSRQNVSSYQLDKMWHYVTTLWQRETGKQMPKFISIAPYTMKCEVMMAMFGDHLSQAYVFAQTDSTFLRQLASHLKRYVFFPGNYIVQQGDIDHTMYFIHKGEVSVLTIRPELIETIHFRLSENDTFGMIQGLIIGKAHDFSYRAETNVEILSLTLSDWQHLLKYFPENAQNIYERADRLTNAIN